MPATSAAMTSAAAPTARTATAPPLTIALHSQKIPSAAAAQNSTNGQPPNTTAATASAAITMPEAMRLPSSLVDSELVGTVSFTASRSGAGLEAAESAFTPSVFRDCVLQRGPVEIRPIGRNKNEFAVGRLPQQKIRQALLPAGADQQARIGKIRRIEMPADHVRGDVAGAQGTRNDQRGDALCRARDFLASTIVECNDKQEAIVVPGQFLGLRQQASDFRLKTLPLADDTHAHIVFVKLREVIADKAAQQTHQIADFGDRPRPVLGAERIDGQNLDTQFADRPHRATQGFDATTMALAARQAALGRPAARAVHDDGHVARRLEAGIGHGSVSRFGRGRGFEHAFLRVSRSGTQTVMISFSLPARV